MKKICINCNKNNIVFIDKYKFHIKYDQNFFKNLNIYYCEFCDLSFSLPVLDESNLSKFYNNIYRAKNRPHSYENIDKGIRDTQFSIISLLTQFIDFNKNHKIYEIGPGLGQIGEIFNKYYSLNIFSDEIDKSLMPILVERGYKFSKPKDIDLVIALHVLEHFTSLKSFFNNFENRLNNDSYLLIEVPNNEKEIWFKEREYDSPHLLFFSKKSLEKILTDRGYKILFSGYTGIDLKSYFYNMKKSKKKYFYWPNIKKDFLIWHKLATLLKFLLPGFLVNLLKFLIKFNRIKENNIFGNTLLDNIVYGQNDRSNIRILAKKTKDK